MSVEECKVIEGSTDIAVHTMGVNQVRGDRKYCYHPPPHSRWRKQSENVIFYQTDRLPTFYET